MAFPTIGILGGGQLGKMLCQAAMPLSLPIWILDESEDFPAAPYCTKFVKGSFKNYNDVLDFGKQVDIITIEIESVNLEALLELEKMGKKVYPSPATIAQIKDKGIQKEVYKNNQLPTAPFRLFTDKKTVLEALENNEIQLPFVQKARKDGYDGRGVLVVNSNEDLQYLMDVPCIVEEKAAIALEIAVIGARNTDKKEVVYDPVEMIFHPTANLVEELCAPARISDHIKAEAQQITLRLLEVFDVVGLLAVEFFVLKDGSIWINEVAPRPHNSGHQTIENCFTSQYEQHLRAIMNFPLGSTKTILPALMLNLLGEDGYSGKTKYLGLNEVLEMEGVFPHFYGKTTTKPKRKMGHLTIIGNTLEEVFEKRNQVGTILKVVSE